MRPVLFCVLALLSAAPLFAAPDTATAKNELTQTLDACGKPSRIEKIPAKRTPGFTVEVLHYGNVSLRFAATTDEPEKGSNFMIGYRGAVSSFDRQMVGGWLPCFATVVSDNQTVTPVLKSTPSSVGSGSDGPLMLLIFGVLCYFVPSLVAVGRNVARPGGIQVVNIFLGWTIIGWVFALAWAATAETEAQLKAKTIDYARLAATMEAQRRQNDAPH